MRTRVLPFVVILTVGVSAQQPNNPRQQPGATITMYAPEQHDLYDGHYVLSANRIYMVGGLNDPEGWDHMDNDAKSVKAVSGTADIDVNELTNTGKFEARLKTPEGDLVLAIDRFNEFAPCQNGGIVGFLHEHGTDSGCGDNNWPKPSRHALCRVVREVGPGLLSQRRFEQSLDARAISPHRVVAKGLPRGQRRICAHGDVDERVDVRISAEIENGGGTFEPEDLTLGNRAVLTVFVVTERECVDAAVCLQTCAGVRDLFPRVGCKDALDEFPGNDLILGRELGQRNAGEHSVTPLQLNSGLHRRFLEHCTRSLRWIQIAQDALGEQELIPIQIARQSGPVVATLIAVHLRPAEGGALAARPAQTQIEMVPGQNDLIRRRCGITADQDA